MDFSSLHSIPSPLWYSLLNARIPAIIPRLLLPSKVLTPHLILLCRHLLFVCSAFPLQLRGCHKSCHIWSGPWPWSQVIGSCGFLVKAGQWILLFFPYCQGLMDHQQSSDLTKQTQKQAKLLVVGCLLCLSFPLLIRWEERLPGIPSLFSRYRVTFYGWSCVVPSSVLCSDPHPSRPPARLSTLHIQPLCFHLKQFCFDLSAHTQWGPWIFSMALSRTCCWCIIFTMRPRVFFLRISLIYLFIYLFIFGCVGSSFLCEGFL